MVDWGSTVVTVRFDCGGDRPCEQCGRWLLADGQALSVELCNSQLAVDHALGYLESLSESTSKADMQRFEDLVDRLERLSIYGDLEPKRELRHLEGDTWEIKTAADRVLFYFVQADGRHKKAVRVTNCAEKTKAKTAQGRLPAKHKNRAARIQKEDRAS
ncbi:hypothetical protein GCM10009816_25750 [Microbacterium aquimaris]